MQTVNVAEKYIGTRALGPGLRSAVWFQGCPFHCKGCYSPAWIPDVPNHLLPADQLAGLLLTNPEIEGVTISGGDPFYQPDGLFDLLSCLRALKPDLSTLVFTGFRLSQLETSLDWRGMDSFKPLIDVLVDGLYMENLNDDIGLRGSSNQVFHHFSNRHKDDPLEFLPRMNEIKLAGNDLQLIGIPTKMLAQFVYNDGMRKV